MSKQTLKKLESYKQKQGLSDRGLALKLGIYHIYLYRWRKAGRIKGAYERIVEDFLNKEGER